MSFGEDGLHVGKVTGTPALNPYGFAKPIVLLAIALAFSLGCFSSAYAQDTSTGLVAADGIAQAEGGEEASAVNNTGGGSLETSQLLSIEPQAASSHGYVWPLKTAGTITNPFQGSTHTGVDIAISQGTEVVAAADGIVKYVQKWDGTVTGLGRMMSYGNLVIVYHPDKGTATYYAHLQDASVSLGQHVSQYQVIGHVGSTGQSDGPHLHFEMRAGAKSGMNTYGSGDGTCVNPLQYVTQNDLGPGGHSPEGFLDVATGGDGTVTVRGWAFDRDDPSSSIEIHVYVGGPAGSGEGRPGIIANLNREDVNKAYGISGKHGFTATFKANKRGPVDVYAYGINKGGGSNAQLVNVKKVTIADPPGKASSVKAGRYVIRAKHHTSSGLDIAGYNYDNNAGVYLWNWTKGDNQRFDISSAGNSAYFIVAHHSNKAVEVPGGTAASDTGISQYAQNKSDAQKWYFDKNSDGTYSIRSRASGLVMDVQGAGTANGTRVIQHANSGANHQKFYLVPNDVSRWSVSSIASRAFTGKAITPAVTVKAGNLTMVKGRDYTVSYRNNVKAGTATVKITGINGFSGSLTKTFKITAPTVTYRTHVQNIGWQKYVKNGAVAGTSGRSLRLEGANIKLTNKAVAGGIQYRTHIQNIGWEKKWKSNGAMTGTSGRSLRLEAIQIRLTGTIAKHYDVYYRVHCQNIGWMGWAKNGARAGTAGHSYRLEAMQIKLVPKGGKAPGSTANCFRSR